jgi:hypothetical protein
MKIKHLKNKTVIELEPKELDKFITQVNNLDSILDTIRDCQDMWISDLNNLSKLRYKLTALLGLTWDSENYIYVKEE